MAQDPFETPLAERIPLNAPDAVARVDVVLDKLEAAVPKGKSFAIVSFQRDYNPLTRGPLAQPFIEVFCYAGDELDSLEAILDFEGGPKRGALDIILERHSPDLKPADLGF